MNFSYLIGNSFIWMMPIIILSLGCLFCKKAGIVNFGAEGIALIGGLFYSIIVKSLLPKISGYSAIVAFTIVFLIGSFLGLIHLIATNYLKANSLLVSFSFYYLGLALTAGFSSAIYWKNNFDLSDIYIENYKTIFLVINFIIICSISFVFVLTKFGLHLKVISNNQFVLKINRINVNYIQFISIIIAYGLICLAGALFVYQEARFNASINNIGWIALAISWLCNNKIILIIFFSYFIALFTNLANFYFSGALINQNNITGLLIFLNILPYLLPLILLPLFNLKKVLSDKSKKTASIIFNNI